MYRQLYLIQILFIIASYSFIFKRISRMNHLLDSDSFNLKLHSTIRKDIILLSKEDIDILVKERDNYRFDKEYIKADEIKLYLEKHNIEITDVSYKKGGQSIWNYKLKRIDTIQTNLMDIAHNSYKLLENCTQDILVKEVIDIIKLQYYTQDNNDIITSNHEIEKQINHLEVINTSIEMQGRKYADAAFEFSLSGITNKELFNLLADCSLSELQRFGYRSTCKSINILQMIEKLAVAGIKNHPIYNEAYRILQLRGVDEKILLQLKPSTTTSTNNNIISSYSLFSDRPLLWLWRYASKQKKPSSNYYQTTTTIINNNIYNTTDNTIDNSIVNTTDNIIDNTIVSNNNLMIQDTMGLITTKQPLPSFDILFKDPKFPLIIDLGCGYGVSLLNMCDQYHKQTSSNTSSYNSSSSNSSYNRSNKAINYLGVDLSHRSISYANGISSRWGYQDTCVFQYCDCLDALDWILQSYLGPIVLVLINFPTPYNINNVVGSYTNNNTTTTNNNNLNYNNDNHNNNDNKIKNVLDNDSPNIDDIIGGNSQLSDSFENFMCSPLLIDKIYKLFINTKKNYPSTTCSLLLQSNVEDVAVTMYNIVKYTNNKYQNEEQFLIPELPYKAYEIINKMFDIDAALSTSSDIINTLPISDITNTLSPLLSLNTTNTITTFSSHSDDYYHWITLHQLVASTNIACGGGRLSQRLQVWLDKCNNNSNGCSIANNNYTYNNHNSIDNSNNDNNKSIDNSNNDNNNNIGNSNNDNSIDNSSNNKDNHKSINYNNNDDISLIIPRKRAFGSGWFLKSPLPYNTKTETEVHCKLELKPVHRILFYI